MKHTLATFSKVVNVIASHSLVWFKLNLGIHDFRPTWLLPDRGSFNLSKLSSTICLLYCDQFCLHLNVLGCFHSIKTQFKILSSQIRLWYTFCMAFKSQTEWRNAHQLTNYQDTINHKPKLHYSSDINWPIIIKGNVKSPFFNSYYTKV